MPAQEILPTAISQEQLEAICRGMIDGNSTRTMCKTENVARSTFYIWLNKWATPEQLDHYAQAMHLRADGLLDETTDISDDSTQDRGISAAGVPFVNHEHINRDRLRVDTRFKLAEKMNPQKYGARQQITGADGGAIKTEDVTNPVDIARKVAFLLAKGAAQLEDDTPKG